MNPAVHIAFVSFSGGNASTIIGPLEVLEFASARCAGDPSIRVSLISKDGATVRCGDSVLITPTCALAEVDDADLVFLAGMPCDVADVIAENADVMDWIRAHAAGGGALATICPTQALLAHAGLLDGRTVAMHWSLVDEVRQRWPAVRWTADRMVVEDQGLYSCCGASAAIDLTLYLVDRFCGHDVMVACAQWFLADLPRVRQQLPPPLAGGLAAGSGGVMAAVESWIMGHFHEAVNFESLAHEFGMSWRTFYRHFQDAFGDSPKVHLQKLRLNAARRLLETDAGSIDQIAARVGYTDPAFFRVLFKRHVGMTPSRYRDNFRFRSVLAAG
ncbi:MAG: helix-turn-helix domain-containing protein [Gammaproteobacteria bacterium]